MNQASFVRTCSVLRVLWIVALTPTIVMVCPAIAEELRVVEGSGLSRAVKVVRGKATVTITIVSNDSVQGDVSCTATNVDGIIADVTVSADAENHCVFDQLKSGTWRVSINPATFRWKAHIEEPT